MSQRFCPACVCSEPRIPLQSFAALATSGGRRLESRALSIVLSGTAGRDAKPRLLPINSKGRYRKQCLPYSALASSFACMRLRLNNTTQSDTAVRAVKVAVVLLEELSFPAAILGCLSFRWIVAPGAVNEMFHYLGLPLNLDYFLC